MNDKDATASIEVSAVPFLRWAGGKRQIVDQLVANLPKDIYSRHYIEPFLGAGSLFFAIKPASALLADANAALISTYRAVKNSPAAVRRALGSHILEHSTEHYYATRKAYNASGPSAAQAARFIYLNKACFNGIFRVNRDGAFNVPKGSKTNLSLPELDSFKSVASALQQADLRPWDYQVTLSKCRSNAFVYLDPPYPALNGTACFTHYTVDRFDDEQQSKLAECVQGIHSRGAHFLLSNADLPSIRSLYSQFNKRRIPVTRYISSNGGRSPVFELLITNY